MKTLGPSLHFFLFFYVTILYQLSLAELKDPYTILGVDRHSSSQEIRRAYKQLAKEWHPDKNTNPDAEERFIKIKQAYELLNDSERRRIYDQHGITNENSHFFKQRHDYSHYGRFASDPFEEFFGKNFFFDQDISLYHKLSITTKYFEQYVVLKSRSVPYLLMFYNDWCFRCTRIVGTLKKLIDVLEPLGIHFATVNAAHEQELVRKTGINDVPSLVLIINGNSYVFRDTGYTSQKVVDFIRKKLPHTIFKKIDDSNFEDFLNSWIDNRVRALISEPRNQTRLRYLLSAFSFQYRVAFGFVDLTNDDSKIIQDRFKLHPSLDSLLIFNEDLERPVASVSMSDIPSQTLTNIIASNQFLTLPRLSSQDILEGVCPTEWNRPRKRLCVVLITKNCEQHNYARSALRHIALQSVFSQDRVRYAYIYKEKQIDFVNAISKGKGDDIVLKLVIIWRRDTTHIKYEWIEDTNLKMGQSSVEMEKFVNLTKQTLDKTIHKLLKTSEELTYEATVQNLFDEHAQSYLKKWLAKCLYVAEYLFDNIEQEHILATVSLFGTIALMFGIGYVMVYFVKAEEESIKSKEQQGKHKVKKQDSTTQELKLHELRAEKYNGMVRLLKPGCRTIILISDLQSRANLIPPFHKAVWPYRKSKTLIFGHMLIEKGLAWYSELLRLSLCESKHLQINPRNCVGTVLAINGHRKYFCMYHAKHPESTGGEKRMVKMTRHLLKRTQDPEIGTFVEIENSDDSESDAKVLLEGSLLDGLNNWLDRLFEGTTHRYYINYWPDFPTK